MKLDRVSSFSLEEDDIYHGMPQETQILYLRGLRRYANPDTGIVGGPDHRISLLSLSELIEVSPHQGIAGVKPNKSKVRRLLGWLERAGLIERIDDKDGYIVYFLPFVKKPYQPGKYISFNSAEDDLLQGIPAAAQLLYLRGLRRFMDYRSAIVGASVRRISLVMFKELVEVFPHQGMKGSRYNKHQIQRLLGWLERAGLIERIEDKKGYLVYLLPLAKNEFYSDAHSSEQKKPNAIHNESSNNKKPHSDAGLNGEKTPSNARHSTKPATHLKSNINNQKTTTPTPPPENRQDVSMADSVVGGGDSDELSEPVKHATQSPQTIATPRQSSHTVEQTVKSASWEEKLIFPDGIGDRDKTAIFCHLNRCPAEQRQAIVDELAARRGSVKSPSGYVRRLVDCALSGEFIPEAGIPLAEARERRKNDFQTTLPTRKPAPSEEVSAEIARLTDAMVAAQRAGDFKQYSRLGSQIGRLG